MTYGVVLITETQLLGITRGLHHLHSNEVIHGDLKGVGRALSNPRHQDKADPPDSSFAAQYPD